MTLYIGSVLCIKRKICMKQACLRASEQLRGNEYMRARVNDMLRRGGWGLNWCDTPRGLHRRRVELNLKRIDNDQCWSTASLSRHSPSRRLHPSSAHSHSHILLLINLTGHARTNTDPPRTRCNRRLQVILYRARRHPPRHTHTKTTGSRSRV